MNQYFDTGLITIDGDTDESEFEIFDILNRNAEYLYVTNHGSNKMFVKTYTRTNQRLNQELWQAFKQGVMDESKYSSQIKKFVNNFIPTAERWIRPRHTMRFHNVSKILIGKTSIGNEYIITEFKDMPVITEDVRTDTDGLMNINFPENVPKFDIINENDKDLVIRISHNESDLSNDILIVPREIVTFYDIRKIEVVKG